MKKITLLSFVLFAFLIGNAQQTISFENSEGFTLGDLNNQNGWTVTGCGPGCFVVNQEVSNEQASDGTLSLKTAVDPAFSGQGGPIIGGFYDLPSPINYTDAIISYDVFITQQDANSSDFRFGVVGADAMGDLFFTYVVDFDFEGNIKIVDPMGMFQVVGTWSIDTWYNIRAEVSGSNIAYFVDNVQVGTSALLNDFDFVSVRFIHNNFGGNGYIDNLRINDEPTAGVDEFASNVFTHSYNKQSDVLTINSSELAFNNIQLYNLLGQEVLNNRLSQTSENINLSQLQDGIYMARVMIGSQFQTLKFIKQ